MKIQFWHTLIYVAVTSILMGWFVSSCTSLNLIEQLVLVLGLSALNGLLISIVVE